MVCAMPGGQSGATDLCGWTDRIAKAMTRVTDVTKADGQVRMADPVPAADGILGPISTPICEHPDAGSKNTIYPSNADAPQAIA